jgi:hypothetical protein
MKHLLVAATALIATMAWMTIPVSASEATFERTLTLHGRVDLNVSTGSGYIHLTHGSGNQVHIFGRVHSNWGGSDEQVKQIAANPPIEQTGNIVRIGGHHENLHNISIDYEIQAPADAYLNAATGSGEVTDDGVGENAKLSTGSGSIHATGLHGGLHAQTGSGSIKATGTPVAPWKLETGSGGVEIWTGDAGITLDAETGSGGVHTDREMSTQGPINLHHVSGKINGGGPMVKIETGSGSIRIH